MAVLLKMKIVSTGDFVSCGDQLYFLDNQITKE